MADHLIADSGYQEWIGWQRDMSRDIGVTTRVTVSIVITGLLQIWGLVRQQGHAAERDILVDHLSVDTLSRVSGVPGFGPAMESVGWVEVVGRSTLRFPRSLDHMTSPEERKRQLATDRKRRQRERDRQRDTERDGHADVTPRVEQRRVEEIVEKREARALSSRRGSRFSIEECEAYARSEPGITNPAAYARKIFESGTDDHRIEQWQANNASGGEPPRWREFYANEVLGLLRDLNGDPRRPLLEEAKSMIEAGDYSGFSAIRERLNREGITL
jgi:hypothetical protein